MSTKWAEVKLSLAASKGVFLTDFPPRYCPCGVYIGLYPTRLVCGRSCYWRYREAPKLAR